MNFNKKARYWTFVAYPESLPCDLRDFLTENGLTFAISPLHDKDFDEVVGEPKKPHYHVLLEFPGPTTYNNIKQNITDVLGQPIPKAVMSIRGAYRYLCHLDNPDKAQYNPSDIVKSESFELVLTKTEVNTLKALVMTDIMNNNIREYYDLVNYYLGLGDYDRLDIAMNNSFFFSTYLSSYRNKLKGGIFDESSNKKS